MIILISMNFELFLINTTVGDVGTLSEDVHLKQNLVNNLINMGTAFLSVQ